VGAYRSFKIPAGLFKDIMLRGLPLMINEMFWSIAVTVANQSYSTRGLNVVAALNIYSTLWNVFSIVFISMGNAIAIVVGNLLGAGKLDEAKDTDRKMIALSVMLAVGMAIILASLSPVFPLLYNTTDDIRALATYLILIASTIMPFSAFNNASYFTIRAGGQVLLTVIFDSGFMWAVSVPVLFCLSRFTVIDIYLLFVIGQSMEILKFVFGFILIKKNNWVRRLVDDK
ncbi:MAG: MATE family efflux transporter, partial [Clostridia bacterium]|nr:MATE family efflux transporter [Clostridia bacterium]